LDPSDRFWVFEGAGLAAGSCPAGASFGVIRDVPFERVVDCGDFASDEFDPSANAPALIPSASAAADTIAIGRIMVVGLRVRVLLS
jgi:hypothetical protein